MNDLLIKIFKKLFTLVDGRISQNVCKVFACANIAGLLLSIASVDGPYTWRAIFCGIVCLMLACFFGSMVMLYEEVFGE